MNGSVQLEGDDGPYVPGDSVEGTVRVDVDERVEGTELFVELHWYTDPERGRLEAASPRRHCVSSGPWTPGDPHEFEFSLKAPPGPYTRSGGDIDINWQVQTSGAGFFDHASFSLRPGDADSYVPGKPERFGKRRAQLRNWEGGKRLHFVFAAVLAVLGAAAVATGVAFDAFSNWWGPWLVGAIHFAAAGFMASLAAERRLKNGLATLWLGDVEVSTSTDHPAPGDEIDCSVQIRPVRDVRIEGVDIRVFGYERSNDEYGSPSETTLHDQTVEPEGAAGASIDAGMTREFSERVPVPDDAAHSVELKWNQVRWRLEVAVRFGGLVEWRSRRLLCVSPGGAKPVRESG